MKKEIILNAFELNGAMHNSHGLWKHPNNKRHRKYKELDYWINLAKLLEKGKFDSIFFADVLGVYDVYKKSKEPSIRDGMQVPINDPALLISAMASVTEHLSFAITASTTYEPPFGNARRFSTLDHLTNGRIAWNIVTSYLPNAARNYGLADMIKHDERYDIAHEYLEVSYKLWEQSWEEGAFIEDVASGTLIDPAKVHEINHNGNYFSVEGPHLSEPSPQRTPVIYQAGASKKGRNFAAKHAECVFIASPTKKIARSFVDQLRTEATEVGRNPAEIKVFSLFTPIVAKTQEEAEAKYEEYKSYTSYDGGLALLGGWTGIDLSEYQPDEELRYIKNEAIHSAVEIFTKIDPDKRWTVQEVAEFVGIGGMGPVAVGSPERIADIMEEWIEETGVDGFNLAYAITPGTFKDFVELVIPVLQERGLVQTEYQGETLRENLTGSSQLPPTHPGKRYYQSFQKV